MIFEMRGISKNYGDTKALQQVNITFHPGKIHALIGSNGAGKTSLIRILTGTDRPSAGTLLIDGAEVSFSCVGDARRMGIVACYQEPYVFPKLSLVENLFLGNEIRTPLGLMNWSEMKRRAQKLLDEFELPYKPSQSIEHLPIPQQHILQLLRALLMEPKMLIMDELTDYYSREENRIIFRKLRELADKGVSVVYITHRIRESLDLADTITVFRNGQILESSDGGYTGMPQIADALLGSHDYRKLPKLETESTKTLLEVTGIRTPVLHDISFSLHYGEALGIAGLLGSGRTSLLRAIVGMDPLEAGKVSFISPSGKRIEDAKTIQESIAYIPENKDRDGLFAELSTAKNITIRNLKRVCHFHLISTSRENLKSRDYADRVGLSGEHCARKIRFLSNGEKQKALIARNTFTNCPIFVFDEATKGIDTAGKVEVYNIINELLRRGGGVIIVSSDFEELMGMCDRILIIRQGEICDELSTQNIHRHELIESLEAE